MPRLLLCSRATSAVVYNEFSFGATGTPAMAAGEGRLVVMNMYVVYKVRWEWIMKLHKIWGKIKEHEKYSHYETSCVIDEAHKTIVFLHITSIISCVHVNMWCLPCIVKIYIWSTCLLLHSYTHTWYNMYVLKSQLLLNYGGPGGHALCQ